MLIPNQGVSKSLCLLLAMLAGLSVANIYYCQPLLNLIIADTGLNTFQVNLMPVLTQIGYALGLLFVIPLGDMYSRRKTVVVNFAVLTCSLLTIFYAHNIGFLLAASFVTGFCSVSPQIFMPFVALYAKPEDKERKTGWVLSGLLLGILASRVISGNVAAIFGWRSVYLVAAEVMLISAVVVNMYFPNVEPTYKGSFKSLMSSIKDLAKDHPSSLFYSLRSAFAFGSFLGLWACLAFRMKEAPYFKGSDVVGLLALCGVAGALTAANVGKFIPKFGVDRINRIGVGLITLAWLLLAFLHNTYAGLIAGIIIIDIGMQCVQLSNQSATLHLCPSATSRMNTIFMVIYFIGGSFGTFLAGSLWSLFGWYGTVASGLILIVLSFAVSLVKKK